MPAGHTRAHAPQLFTSVARSRHTLMQSVVPAPHDTTQAPREHSCPAGHARAQAPQLFTSVCVSRQVPSQLVRPAAHDTTHAPIEHT